MGYQRIIMMLKKKDVINENLTTLTFLIFQFLIQNLV